MVLRKLEQERQAKIARQVLAIERPARGRLGLVPGEAHGASAYQNPPTPRAPSLALPAALGPRPVQLRKARRVPRARALLSDTPERHAACFTPNCGARSLPKPARLPSIQSIWSAHQLPQNEGNMTKLHESWWSL